MIRETSVDNTAPETPSSGAGHRNRCSSESTSRATSRCVTWRSSFLGSRSCSDRTPRAKSNFLDALQLLSRLATSRTLREAFAPPYRGKPLESFSFGHDGLRGLLDRKRLHLSIEADIELSEAVVDAVNREIRQMDGTTSPPAGSDARGERAPRPSVRHRNLRYRIDIEMAPRSGELRLYDEYLGALIHSGTPERIRPFIERHEDLIWVQRESEQNRLRYGRADCSVLSQGHYPPQHPHVVAARREFDSWRFHYLDPRERMRLEDPVEEVRRIGPMGEGLAAFLNTLKSSAPKQFRALEKALHALVPNVDGIDVKVNDYGEAEISLKENGSEVSARLLSDGTLRMLGTVVAHRCRRCSRARRIRGARERRPPGPNRSDRRLPECPQDDGADAVHRHHALPNPARSAPERFPARRQQTGRPHPDRALRRLGTGRPAQAH